MTIRKISAALLIGAYVLCAPVLRAQLSTNFIALPVRLAFDYTNDTANLSGFLLFQSTSATLPLDQWTPVMGVPASAYVIPGTNFALPAFTNFVAVVKTNGQAISATQFYFTLASTNSDFGTNAMSFSNTVQTKGLPLAGSNFRRQ